MFSWIRLATSFASRMKFPMKTGSAEYFGSSILSATTFSNPASPIFFASKTAPMPPSAISRTIS